MSFGIINMADAMRASNVDASTYAMKPKKQSARKAGVGFVQKRYTMYAKKAPMQKMPTASQKMLAYFVHRLYMTCPQQMHSKSTRNALPPTRRGAYPDWMLYRRCSSQHSWYRILHYQEEPRLYVREFRLTPARAHVAGAWTDLKDNVQVLEHGAVFDQHDVLCAMLPDEIRQLMVRVLGHRRVAAYLTWSYRAIQMEYGVPRP